MSIEEAKELQIQELEVLESIYNPDELNIVSREYPSISLDVKIPFESNQGPSDNTFTLHAAFPPTYPFVAPILELKGVEECWPESSSAMKAEILAVAEENIQMPMIFTLVSSSQDILVKYSNAQKDEAVKKAEEERMRIEREEQARFEGDRVTVEKFSVWKATFMAEIEALKRAEAKIRDASLANQLSGKQLFLRDSSLAISDLKLSEADLVDIDESLFMDDLNLEGEEVDEE